MLKQLFKSDFIKNSSILIIGTVLAQIIPIALQPIIRRTYTDAETGRFDLYLSIVAILASIAHFNYARTVVIPKSDKSAANLLAISILFTFFVSLASYIFFFWGSDFIIAKFSLPIEIKPWLLFIPLSTFFIGTYTSINFWLTRQKKFKTIAINKLARRSSEGFTQIGLKSMTTNGLIFGNLVGDFFNFLIHIVQLAKTDFKWKDISYIRLKKELKAYKDFPIYSLFPTFINTISSSLPIIIINDFFGDKITGQFGLSKTVLMIPLALISVALSQVLLQKIAEKKNKKETIGKLLKEVFLGLSLLSIIGLIIIQIWGTDIFNIAFGEKWGVASDITKILIFYYSIDFVITPLSIVFIPLQKIKINSAWQIGRFIITLSLYLLKDFSLYEFIYYYMAINIAAYLIYGVLIYKTVTKFDNSINLKTN